MFSIEDLATLEKNKQKYQSLYKEKSDILHLKKEPEFKVKWPPTRSIKKREGRLLSTASKSKLSKHSRPLYRKKALLPQKKDISLPELNNYKSLQDIHDKTSYEITDLVDEFLIKNCKNVDQSKTESIKDLSLDLLDGMFANLANVDLLEGEKKAELGWEFVIGNMLQLGLPQTVIDRVKKRMEQQANKSSPAITAMNVTRPLLSDLTITTAEVEMQQEIQKLVTENEVYESRLEDKPFEDSIKWLIDLDRKDQYSKDKEIEKIHLGYTKILSK